VNRRHSRETKRVGCVDCTGARKKELETQMNTNKHGWQMVSAATKPDGAMIAPEFLAPPTETID
jgi:hypothetical protein